MGRAMHSRYAARLASAAIGLGLVGIAASAYAQPAYAQPAYAQPAGHLIARAQGPVVSISPDVAEPGDSVEIDTNACGFDSSANASSPAFEASIDLKAVDEATRLVGTAKVDQHTEPGHYTVSVECVQGGGATIEGELRVVPPESPNTGGGGLASTGGIGQDLAGTAANGLGRGPGTGGLPAGQGAALLLMLGAGALTGAVVAARARRRRPDPS
jgi:hypothetical protein